MKDQEKFEGVKVNNGFWDEYSELVNEYHSMVKSNYDKGKITLKEKSKAHANVQGFFEDFFLACSRLTVKKTK